MTMPRETTRRQADPLLGAVAAAHGKADQPDALFAALDAALMSGIGHRLFTILAYDDATGDAATTGKRSSGAPPTMIASPCRSG